METPELPNICVYAPVPETPVDAAAAAASATTTAVKPATKTHSICIPRMDADISKGFIFNVFRNMKIGYIENIVEVPIKADARYKRVFIKIKWNKSQMANYINDRFNADLNIKVVHTLPWYWICVSNRHIK